MAPGDDGRGGVSESENGGPDPGPMAVVTCPRCGEDFPAASLSTVPLEIERHRLEKHATTKEAG